MKPGKGPALMGLLAFCWMLVCTAFPAGDWLAQLKTQTFPPVTARLGKAEPEYRVHTSNDRRGNPHTTTETRVRVPYQYQVGAQTYSALRLCYGPYRPPGFTNVESFARKHPAGSTIEAYYNPADPAQSVLVRGLTEPHWMALLGRMLVVGLFGLLALSRLEQSLTEFFVVQLALTGVGTLGVILGLGPNLSLLLALPALASPLLAAAYVVKYGVRRQGLERKHGDEVQTQTGGPLILMTLISSVFLFAWFNDF